LFSAPQSCHNPFMHPNGYINSKPASFGTSGVKNSFPETIGTNACLGI
jgi:hypothetical protein